MITITRRVRTRLARMRRNDSGSAASEMIFIIVGVLFVAGIVIAAVTAFVQGQIAQLP